MIVTDDSSMTMSHLENDFFKDMMVNSFVKTVSLAISMLGILLCSFSLSAIIWYEKYGIDQKRTIINMYSAMFCWVCLEFLFFIQIPESVRFVYGPLPIIICHGQSIMRNCIVAMWLSYMNASIITKYFLIFWIKNPAAFYNEFWCIFVSICIHFFPFLIELSRVFLAADQTLGFNICTGRDPSATEKKDSSVFGMIIFLSGILHAAIYIRIFAHNHKEEGFFKSKTAIFKVRFLIISVIL